MYEVGEGSYQLSISKGIWGNAVCWGLQTAYSATLRPVFSFRSPSIWQQGGYAMQPPRGPEIIWAGGY